MKQGVTTEGKRVLVTAPFGRDAQSLCRLLESHGHEVQVCTDLVGIADAFDDRIGAILLTEDALRADLLPLSRALAAQQPWSDVPFIVLAGKRTGADVVRRRLPETASNVIVLDRPLGSESLVSAVASAMRSRQKQFEVRDSQETLEQRVAERTEALHAEMASRAQAEAALRQSQKMEAVGQLTGGIAHDFNNMLTGVIGGLDIMRRRIATGRLDDLDRFMDAATESAQRAAALTARLLAFSRRQSLDAKPIDVIALIASLDRLLQTTMDEQVSIAVVHEKGLPFAFTDANQLENAILNLCLNARDAMPDGGALTIETSVADFDDSYAAANPDTAVGRYVVIAVSDTGVGMSAEVLDKVYEPFFTTKPIGQGTGLGLSMVYGFAKQSGGQVRIHSREGEGTSVKIFLPASEAPGITIAKPNHGVPSGRGQTILVVEDDPSVRLLVCDVLSELGYRAIAVPEAGEAIRILSSDEGLDLMVSDVGLPGMNGRQLAEIAREHRPRLPILFVTGYAENAAIRAGFLGTNMGMVTKPFSLEILALKIDEMLSATPPDSVIED